MSDECCATCRFWDHDDVAGVAAPEHAGSTCRRFPPVQDVRHVLVVLHRGHEPMDDLSWEQPSTAAGEWCGEYQRRPLPMAPPA